MKISRKLHGSFVGTVTVVIMLVASALSAGAKVGDDSTLEMLRAQVKYATSATDSIKALYNLYDALSDKMGTLPDKQRKEERIESLRKMLSTSLNSGKYGVALDAIRNLSAIYKDDNEKQHELYKITQRLPVSAEQRETLLFIRLTRNSSGASRLTLKAPQERAENLKVAVKDYQSLLDNGEDDYLKKIESLFNLVVYGSTMIQSKEINDYLHQLDSLITLTHSPDASLANAYYTQAAQIYTQLGESEKAITADRHLLDIIERLDERTDEIGREYKDYDGFRFVVYRRMLSNFQALSPEEVDELYSKIQALINKPTNEPYWTHAVDYVEAMYAMAKKDYPRATNNFRKVLDADSSYAVRPSLIMKYLKAAERTNSTQDIIRAQKYYIDILKDQSKMAIDNEYSRLAMKFNIDAIKQENQQKLDNMNRKMDAEAAQNALENHRLTVIIMAVIGLALFVILLLVTINFRRQRRLNKEMRKVNDRLTKERDAMHQTQEELTVARDRARDADRQKTEFIHSISHEVSEPLKAIVGYSQLIIDSIEGPRRQYLNRFIDIIEANTQILQRLVNDVLNAAELENSQTTVTIQNVSVESTLSLLADIYRPRLPEGLSLVVEPVDIISDNINDSGTIDSDPQRLEQIINNVLNNAVKFTEKGQITIESTIDRPAEKLTVSISDSGPGIPEGMEEKCFDRFEKLGRYTTGTGLGLHVSRLLARLLGGDIVVDKHYKNGARFIITLPIRHKKQK